MSKDVKNEFFIVDNNSDQLAETSSLANEGRLSTMVDSVWDFDDYEKGFAKLAGGHVRGKVVIKVTE